MQRLALMLLKPCLRLLNRPILTLVKKITLNLSRILAFGLANNRFNAFLRADRYGAEAILLKIVRTTVTRPNKILTIFPRNCANQPFRF